ncbi:MAG: hypothetical protein ACPL1K_06350, partial [Candidatus Kryptoniota bacterium]
DFLGKKRQLVRFFAVAPLPTLFFKFFAGGQVYFFSIFGFSRTFQFGNGRGLSSFGVNSLNPGK